MIPESYPSEERLRRGRAAVTRCPGQDACGLCAGACGFGALTKPGRIPVVDHGACIGCGGCVKACPNCNMRLVDGSREEGEGTFKCAAADLPKTGDEVTLLDQCGNTLGRGRAVQAYPLPGGEYGIVRARFDKALLPAAAAAKKAGISIETLRLDGFTMDWFRFGSGKTPFVIIPGLSVQSVMGAAAAVEAEYAEMTDDFTVYVFDRRRELREGYSIRDMAHDTALAMDALGLRDVCLFGASQGGMIAMEIAIERPELVKKLVLGSTSANVRERQNAIIDGWIQKANEGNAEGLYLSFGKELYPPAVFEQYRSALLAAAATVTQEELRRFTVLASAVKGFKALDRLDRISCPVLAIGVYEDAVLDSDATMEIAEKLDERPDFRLYMYIGFGHAAFDTAPDYRKRIMRFLLDPGRPGIEN